NPKVVEFIETRTGDLIKSVSNTTKEALRATLKEGVELGESIPKLAKRIASVYDDAQGYRSVLIARTETQTAMNNASLNSYRQSTICEKKTWLTAGDARVRPEHEAMDGETVPLEEPFSNGLMHPGEPNCYSKDTEIYTKTGWKLIKDVIVGETVLTLIPESRQLEWNKVKETIFYKQNKMNHLTNKCNTVDMLVSLNHPYFGYKRIDRGKAGRKVEPIWYNNISEVETEFKFYVSSKWVGLDKKIIDINGIKFRTEDYCRLMGYFLSEGSIVRRNNTRWQISIAQSNHLQEMWNDIKDLPLNHKWLGKDKIYISDNKLGDYLSQFGKSYEKYIPEEIKELSTEYIKVFLDAFILGDGSVRKRKIWHNRYFAEERNYFTSSKRMADDLGELIIKAGKSVSYVLDKCKGKKVKFRNGTYTINHNLWRINELSSQYRTFDILMVKEVDYNDFVYDVEVKNNTILTRRNGSVIWGSNCRCCMTAVLFKE
ncbi:MAG: phage minor head protein, partial [Promethearchaeota archaeon]